MSSCTPRSVMSVSVYPGQTALTVIPNFAVSSASDRVSPTTPCLAAAYADMRGAALRPAVDAMLTMRPAFAPSIAGNTCCVHRKTDVRFAASMVSHVARVVFPNFSLFAWPALLTRIWASPNRVRAASNAFLIDVSSVTSQAMPTALSPSDFAWRSSTLRSRPMIVTLAPAVESIDDIAAPMPRAPPVTIACLFASLVFTYIVISCSCPAAPSPFDG